MNKLTDLEICRKIADIEDIHYTQTRYKGNTNFIALLSENDFTGTLPEMIGKYDPLNDDALCFKLMVRHSVELSPMFSGCYCATVAKTYTFDEQINYKLCKSWLDDNPNKAICLAIIEAHNE